MADSTQGNGAPEAPQGNGDAQKFVTEDQLNRAITARFGAFEKSFGTKIDKSLTDFSSAFGSKLEEAFAARAQPTQPTSAPTDTPKPSIEESPQFKGLQKQLAELQKKAADAESAREAERAKSMDVSLRQRLAEQLAPYGVDPARAKHAIGYLVDAEKRVRWGEDDSLVFKDGDSYVDLATGLKSWATSDDAKIYLQPRGASGSGERPAQTQTARGTTAPDAREQLKSLLIANYLNPTGNGG